MVRVYWIFLFAFYQVCLSFKRINKLWGWGGNACRRISYENLDTSPFRSCQILLFGPPWREDPVAVRGLSTAPLGFGSCEAGWGLRRLLAEGRWLRLLSPHARVTKYWLVLCLLPKREYHSCSEKYRTVSFWVFLPSVETMDFVFHLFVQNNLLF